MEAKMILQGYFIYLPIAIFLTFYVSRILFKNGKVFMIDIFRGKEEIANATNKLFEVGFYLMNIGWALLILKIEMNLFHGTYQSLVEILSKKIGGFAIYLGVMLFFNMYLFFRGRSKSRERKQIVIQE